MSMRRQSGRALGKWLLLILAIAALAFFYQWKNNYGVTGHVEHIPFETRNCVVFVRQDAAGKQNLYMVNAETGEERRLTSDGLGKRAPMWSPDGKQVAYASDERGAGSGTFQIFTLGAGQPVCLTRGSTAKDAPRWSPDGKVIAYLSGGTVRSVLPNGDGSPQIYPPPHKGGYASGTEEKEGDHAEESEGGQHPPIQAYDWAPNGLYIAAIQVFEGENAAALGEAEWWNRTNVKSAPGEAPRQTMADPEGVLLLPQSGGVAPFGLSAGNRVGMSWFADGQRIAIAASSHTRGHTLVVRRVDDPNLSPVSLLTAQGYTISAESPAVSPDGKLVAFEVVRLDSAENREIIGIAVVASDAMAPITIGKPADVAQLRFVVRGATRRPMWSPDGQRIVYSMISRAGARDLWTVKADGSAAVNLTKGQGDNSDPNWSPAR